MHAQASRSIVMSVLVVTLVPTLSVGAEKRCTDLGANCVCSEPFQMAAFTTVQGSWLNPGDSASQECGAEVATAPITRPGNQSDIIASTDATALSRLPTGHTISRFLATKPGVNGMLFVGGTKTSADLGTKYNARMSMRAYIYHSPDYNFRDETPPCHSKLLQGQVGAWHLENKNGFLEMYQFTGSNWGPSQYFPRDCCRSLPGGTAPSPNHGEWKGHWFFVENVVTKRAGPGVRHQLFMRDITKGVTQWNGGREGLVVDWYGTVEGVDGGAPQGWEPDFNHIITSSPAQVPMDLNLYREISSGGACNGWRGVTHMMISGWDTDLGQRIGPAVEVEGTALPPAVPTNVQTK